MIYLIECFNWRNMKYVGPLIQTYSSPAESSSFRKLCSSIQICWCGETWTKSSTCLSRRIKLPPSMYVPVIRGKCRIILKIGKSSILTSMSLINSCFIRTPANCGYFQANYPECLSQPPPNPRPRPYYLLNSGMFLCRPSAGLYDRLKKMLDTSPLVPDWKFCDQDLIGTFFGGGGAKNEKDWGDITKEELGDDWMPVPYYYNALRPMK